MEPWLARRWEGPPATLGDKLVDPAVNVFGDDDSDPEVSISSGHGGGGRPSSRSIGMMSVSGSRRRWAYS
jgi:hypothetical protein